MSEKYNTILNNQFDSGNCSLIPGSNQGAQNTYNDNSNNLTQNEMIIQMEKCDVICYSLYFIFFILIALALLIGFIVSKITYIAVLVVSIILSILIFSLLLYFSLNVKHIKLIKNQSLNLLTVKKISYLNCAKSTFNFNLQNVIADIITRERSYKGRHYTDETLVISKMFNNNSEIDLHTSNIKNKPIKNLYYVFDGFKKGIYTSLTLKNFLNINPEIENPVNFNISKYMGKSDEIPKYHSFSRYMKMSDHFFTYFLKESCCYCGGISCSISIASIALLFASWPIIMLFISDEKEAILSIAILLIFMLGIPFIGIIFNILAVKKHSLRIDIIYSKNFDTLFIGLLNHNGTSYKKTFIHSINTIERFVFDNYEGSFNKSILKVIYKDRTNEDIVRIDESKFTLDGLLFILNEKFSNYQQV